MSILVCENLTKKFNKKININDFNYNFLENNIYSLIGKTDSLREQLLDLISGKAILDSGAVYLDGELLNDSMDIQQKLCYISRKMKFPANFKIETILKYFSSFYPKWDNNLAYEILANYNLKDNILYYRLTPTQKSLLNAIIGLSSKANITIFDNPLKGCDVKDRYDFFNFFYNDYIINPRTIIMSTDYIDEIDFLTNKILFIDNGVLFDNYNTEALKNNFKYLTGKTEVLSSLISGIKVIGFEERGNMLTVCIREKLRKDDIRKYQKYMVKISPVPIQKVFIYLINLRKLKGLKWKLKSLLCCIF